MGLIDIAGDTLKEIPISDVLRERFSLALDRLAQLEAENEELKSKLAVAHSRLENERLDHQKTQQELEGLRKLHEEEVRIFYAIEFRRGKRTGDQWIAFCPRCHMPASLRFTNPLCSNGDCHWRCDLESHEIASVIARL